MALQIFPNQMGTLTPVSPCVFSSTHILHGMGPWASCAAAALSQDQDEELLQGLRTGSFWPLLFRSMKVKDLLTVKLSHGKCKVGKSPLVLWVALASLLTSSLRGSVMGQDGQRNAG